MNEGRKKMSKCINSRVYLYVLSRTLDKSYAEIMCNSFPYFIQSI